MSQSSTRPPSQNQASGGHDQGQSTVPHISLADPVSVSFPLLVKQRQLQLQLEEQQAANQPYQDEAKQQPQQQPSYDPAYGLSLPSPGHRKQEESFHDIAASRVEGILPASMSGSASSRLRGAAGITGVNLSGTNGALSKLPPTRVGMPHFSVEKFLRSNHRLVNQYDRISASEILKIDPADRDDEQLKSLSSFLSSVNFFAGLNENLRRDIAGIASLRTCRKDEIVYGEGEESTCLYVILTGSVGTRVKEFVKPGHARQATSMGNTFVASVLGAGECFGTESMGSEDRTLPRTQTKIALEKTELLQVDMRDYKAILRISLTKESREKIDFVSLLPIFEMCNLRELHRISSCLTVERYAKNDIILKQGEKSEKVYFIQSGEVRVIHKIYTRQTLHNSHFSRLNSPDLRRTGTANTNGTDDHELNRASGMSDLTGYGFRSNTAGGAGTTAAQPSSGLGKGGGALKFERARAFTAARNGAAHNTQQQQQLSTSHAAKRPQWGQPATSAQSQRSSPATSSPSTLSIAQQLSSLPRSIVQPQLLDLGRLGPKWVFGEMGVLKNEPRSASIYAETNVTLMVMTKEDFFTRLPPFCIRYLEDYITTFYAPSPLMRDQWHAQQRWDEFKAKMLQTNRRQGTTMETNKKFSSTLNAIKY